MFLTHLQCLKCSCYYHSANQNLWNGTYLRSCCENNDQRKAFFYFALGENPAVALSTLWFSNAFHGVEHLIEINNKRIEIFVYIFATSLCFFSGVGKLIQSVWERFKTPRDMNTIHLSHISTFSLFRSWRIRSLASDPLRLR